MSTFKGKIVLIPLQSCWTKPITIYKNVDSILDIETHEKVNHTQRWVDTIKKSFHYELYQRSPNRATTPEPHRGCNGPLLSWNKKIQSYVYSKHNVITKEDVQVLFDENLKKING